MESQHQLRLTRAELNDSRAEIEVLAGQLRFHRKAPRPRGRENRTRSQEDRFSPDDRKVTILHFNDVYHVAAREDSPCGGAARVAGLILDVRKEPGVEPLVICSGDVLGPSLISCISKGSHMISALNLINVHYGCIGNHDLDYGIENC